MKFLLLGLPCVSLEKYNKLLLYANKLVQRKAVCEHRLDWKLEIPLATLETRGVGYVFCTDSQCEEQHMENLKKELDYYRFDSKHTLRVLSNVCHSRPCELFLDFALDYSLLYQESTSRANVLEQFLPLDIVKVCTSYCHDLQVTQDGEFLGIFPSSFLTSHCVRVWVWEKGAEQVDCNLYVLTTEIQRRAKQKTESCKTVCTTNAFASVVSTGINQQFKREIQSCCMQVVSLKQQKQKSFSVFGKV